MDSRIEELVRACRQGDQASWRRLVEAHAGLVFAVARRRGLSREECEDAAQHTFTQLFKRLNNIDDPRALPAWLITTATRESVRLISKRRSVGASAHAEGVAAPIEADSLERHHRVRLAVDILSPPCRDLIRVLFWESPSPDYMTISQRLGIPVGSIGPNRARCLAKLAKLLGRDG